LGLDAYEDYLVTVDYPAAPAPWWAAAIRSRAEGLASRGPAPPRSPTGYAFFRFFAGAGCGDGRSVFTSTIARAVRFIRSRPSSHCCGMLAMLLTV
jgi:hypothetical protein